MALGGGTFITENKVLPGSYINFVSAAKATATLSDRGVAALGLSLGWGPEEKVQYVDGNTFLTDTMAVFGYDYTAEEMWPLRELFLHAKEAYIYRLNKGGAKASCDLATAKYPGVRGNAISVTVTGSDGDFVVETFVDGKSYDSQSVTDYGELKENDFVVFDKSTTLAAGTKPLSGGSDGNVTAAEHSAMLGALESYAFNTLGCLSTEEDICQLYVTYTKQMRDDYGRKFQTVLYKAEANHEGIIRLETAAEEGEAALVPWVVGASCGCEINKSNTNLIYDGTYTPICNLTQKELEDGMEQGAFLLHRVGEEIRVLEDINSFTEFSQDKGEDFSYNQIIRVLDQIGNDIAVLFNNNYLGKVQNNNSGRIAFWNDIITYDRELAALGAIEDVVADDVVVEIGKDKKSVAVTNPITPVCAMSKLYMTVIVQ